MTDYIKEGDTKMDANAVITTIIDNIWVIVAAIVCLVVAIVAIIKFAKVPSAKKLAALKKWLLWAVTKAEAELGSKTGKLKLAKVYDMFIERFPWLAKIISVEKFSGLVDEALVEMREMLAEDKELLDKVNGFTPVAEVINK